MRTVYVCQSCGEGFDESSDCLKHEEICKLQQCRNKCKNLHIHKFTYKDKLEMNYDCKVGLDVAKHYDCNSCAVYTRF